MLFGRRKRKTIVSGPHARRLVWGGCEIPDDPRYLASSFAIAGAPGAGKTLLLAMLTAAVLRPTLGVPAVRSVMLDEKFTAYPLLRGMGVAPDHIKILNAYDLRSHAWDLAADLDEPSAMTEAARIFAPSEKASSQPFFIDAAQDILACVFRTLHAISPGHWTLLDVIRATRSIKALRQLLKKTADGRELLSTYVNIDSRTASNILATLRTKLAPFEPVAALWSRATATVSLRDWMHPDCRDVLVLGSDDARASALRPINQAIFRRASELVTGRVEEYALDETWFLLDELRVAGRLSGLETLLLKGRSKGARLALAFQDLDGLMAVWGEKEARELLAMCGNLAILRQFNANTMDLFSRLLGDYEYDKVTTTTSEQTQGSPTQSIAVTRDQKRIMHPGEFRELPFPSKERGIVGVFATPLGFWRGCIEPAFIDKHLPRPTSDPGFVPRPVSHQTLPQNQHFDSRDNDAVESHLEPQVLRPRRTALRTMDNDLEATP